MELTNSSLLVIAGPTGSGKSALALSLAQAFSGEIVNYDSVQVYRGLNIGSAKTPPLERAGIPHHLLDVISPTDELTAGAYSALARACLRDIAARGLLPILVGGTGFYLRSLLDGLSPAPERDPGLRIRLNQLAGRRPEALHRFLRRAHPAAAGRVHANDHQKLIRAIELAATPVPSPRQPLVGFQILKIGLNPPRPELYARLDQRSAAMFEAGLLVETQMLLGAGIPPTGKALLSLGYKQAVAVLENRLTMAAAIEEVQIKTRQYAKRQMTWFRRESDIHWLTGFGHQPEIEQAALELIRSNCLSQIRSNSEASGAAKQVSDASDCSEVSEVSD